MKPEDIFNLIKSNPFCQDYKYVVLGRPGPTGKSWITRKLKEIGCDAVEISELVYRYISYTDYENSYIFDSTNKICTIILNNWLR